MQPDDQTARTPPPDSRVRERLALLTLRLCEGLGPVLIARLRDRFGSAADVLDRSSGELRIVEGIGEARARSITGAISKAADKAKAEIERAEALGIRLVSDLDEEYPELLRPISDAPPLLYVRGSLDALRFPVAIVGSRRCSAYGLEQADRFAEMLARTGLSVVSGGARGIDTAAHRAVVRARGNTVAVLGCGLAHCYPAENAALYERIAGDTDQPGCGAVVSELPLDTPPSAENFPARNRIISGISLGVLVIEAAARSGALITARLAVEEHNREVMALPGRTSDGASAGTNELIRTGSAAMVIEPAHVIEQLEAPAVHLHGGTHGERYQPQTSNQTAPSQELLSGLPKNQQQIYGTLDVPRSVDELIELTGLSAATVRSDLTLLELAGLISTNGSRIQRI